MRLSLVFALCLCIVAAAAAGQQPELVVVYSQADGLWLWRRSTGVSQQLIAAPGVTPAEISPAGAHVAYWQLTEAGALQGGVVSMEGETHFALLDGADRTINSMAWADAEALLFSTAAYSGETDLQAETAGDLRRLDLASGEITVLEAGPVNHIAVAPGGSHWVLSAPGIYDDPDAPARLIITGPDAGGTVEVFSYPAVSTGSTYTFKPALHWLPDGASFRVAIPAPDAVYASETPPVALWEIGLDGTAQQIGQVEADYFSVLENQGFWSPAGSSIGYTRRAGIPEDNRMALCIAAGDGSSPACFAEGEIGSLTPLGWAGDERLIYRESRREGEGFVDQMWLVRPGDAPSPFPGAPLYSLSWLADQSYLYTTLADQTAGLYYMPPDGEPAAITAGAAWIDFTARLVGGG